MEIMKYNGEVYGRYINPPQDKEVLIRWKIGNMKVYDKISDNQWIEWKLYGRWNTLKWLPCEEPEVERYYQTIKSL
jgi:hypothetical protein